MDNEIIGILSQKVFENFEQYFESGPEYEIITQRKELAKFLTGKERTDVSKFIEMDGFPSIKDEKGNIVGWSWRAVRKWEFQHNRL